MNKELAFTRTQYYLISAVQNTTNISSNLNDYIGAYTNRDGINYCFGSVPIHTDNVALIMYGDEEDAQGFYRNEIVNLFFYNSEQNKYYKLNGTYLNYSNSQYVDNIEFIHGSIYIIAISENNAIGDEIQLTSTADVTLSIDCVDECDLKSNDTIKIKLIYNNIDNPKLYFFGDGILTNDKYFYYYKPSFSDSKVVLLTTGIDVFSEKQVLYTKEINIFNSTNNNVYFENEDLIIYNDLEQLMFKPKIVNGAFVNVSWESSSKSKSNRTNEPISIITLINKKNVEFTLNYYITMGDNKRHTIGHKFII